MKVRPVILSGGAGTRLWPVSRARFPKQFADLYGDMCLFARALELVADRSMFEAPIIVANKEHKFLILDVLARSKITDATVLLEPEGRNTGAAAIVTALAERDQDIFHLVLPSDHVIMKPDRFWNLVQEAKAGHDRFVLLGIKPDRPETGFGYIVPGPVKTGASLRPISRFVEKPDEEGARALIAEGAVWNSGIFFYAPRTLIGEAQTLAPKYLELCERALREGFSDLGCTMLAEAPYGLLDKQPFDKLVMEKTGKGSVIVGDFGWSDVGTWNALWQIEGKDEHQTVKRGDVLAKDVRSSYLRSYGPALAVMGVDNLTVVATKDAVLVMPLARSQNVREIVASMDEVNGSLALEHPRVMRPWGAYEGIAKGSGFQVKQITVLPGRSLSLQKHHHRAEHWVVVAGTARMECDGVEKLLLANQSAFIPQGSVHRLSNAGQDDLQLIEVQSGDYLGEDDIIRYSDDYGRS
jgi:mannose-1-phosphate guanylyltransferase/mannose-6-phosphate isomerase